MPMLGEYDLERLLDALRMQESGGNNSAVSPKGARGAYQFMPATWENPGYGLPDRAGGTFDNFLRDEQLQRKTAGDYLKAMYDRTGSVPAALASYNGGLGRGMAFKNGQPVPAETANYVPSVLGHYNKGAGATQPAAPSAQTPRMQWDALMERFNPISAAQAAEGDPSAALFHPSLTPEMTGPKAQDRLDPTTPVLDGVPPRTGGLPAAAPEAPPAPPAMPDMMEGFAMNAPTPPGQGPAEELPMNLAPPGATPSPAQNAGFDPDVASYFDALTTKPSKWGPMGSALMAIGGGLMESGGMRGMGSAGRAAGDALLSGQALDLKQRQIEAENLPLSMRYQRNIDNGMSSTDAFLDAVTNDKSNVSPGFRIGPDGKQTYVEGGSHDPAVIAREAKTRADAQVEAISGSDEVKDVVSGIERGDLPPSTTGMYRYGVAVKAALAKKGFNFAKASLEYKAAERQIAGLNAPRMTMFVGLANSVLATMDRVKALSSQMKNSGLTGYNKAKLEVLVHTQGNTPAGQLATQYLAATNTLKEEFANLATGGYAPTEAAWKLADDQVNGNYGVDQMAASIDELKRLINYRLQAVPGLMERGPGGANRYTGQQQLQMGDTGHGVGGDPTAMPPAGLTPEDAEAWQNASPEERAQIEELYGIAE
jgi:hypothetical protein